MSIDGGTADIGYATTAQAMREAKFDALELEFRPASLDLPTGPGCEWTTIGAVPSGPGLYAFTVGPDDDLRVMYVGLTEELWMVTKGRLPAGGARPGQRYGRPRYAGVTRQRINALIACCIDRGDHVRHWVRAMSDLPQERNAMRARLLEEEQKLIATWKLRAVGWNRG